MPLRPLTRDYWPIETPNPLTRLALAAALTPAAAALAATLVVAAAHFAAPYRAEAPFSSFPPLFFELAVEFYVFCAVGVAPAFVALWSLRRRSRTAFALAGLAAGGLGALVSFLRFGDLPWSQMFIAFFLGVALMLAFRVAAGLRDET